MFDDFAQQIKASINHFFNNKFNLNNYNVVECDLY